MAEKKPEAGSNARLKAAAQARKESRLNLFERLASAVTAGEASRASELIAQGAPLRWPGRVDALSLALQNAQPQAALACVRGGARLSEANGLGHRISAYDFAVDSGLGELFTREGRDPDGALSEIPPAWMALALLMLDHGANPNEADGEGVSSLITAGIFNQARLARALIDKGADLEGADRYGNTALVCAAAAGALDALIVLLEAGANASVCGFSGQNAALRAMSMGGIGRRSGPRCVALLLEAGCDPDALDSKGDSARQAIERVIARGGVEGVGELRSALERWDMEKSAQAPASGKRAASL